MRCSVCKGACCEEFAIPFVPVAGDVDRWLNLHGTVRGGNGKKQRWIHFEAACTKLDERGRCTIYNDRPETCKHYRPGCYDCLDVVMRRRTPEQYAYIRSPSDPARIHPKSVAVKGDEAGGARDEKGAPAATDAPV